MLYDGWYGEGYGEGYDKIYGRYRFANPVVGDGREKSNFS